MRELVDLQRRVDQREEEVAVKKDRLETIRNPKGSEEGVL